SAADGRAEIQNGLNEAQFMVIEAVDPNTGGGSVSVTLYCGGAGTIASDNPQTVTEASPGEWTVTGLSSTATCTATEDPVPAGYTPDQSDCADRELTVNGSVTCTIKNTPNEADFDFLKIWSDDSDAEVTVTLDCDGNGTIEPDATQTTDGQAVGWTIKGYTGDPSGITCTVTEDPIPDGYTASGDPAGTCEAT